MTVRSRRRVLKAVGGAVLAPVLGVAIAPGSSRAADDWPARPMRLVVPFAPGGVTDLAGRVLSECLSKTLGTVVVENKGGGGGNIGVTEVARATPDGYTLLMATFGNIVLNPHLYRDLPFNPRADLVPVAQTMTSDLVLVAGPALEGATSLAAFIELAKTGKRKLSMASAGNGSGAHILGELLQKVIGAEFVHVPYKGTGPALNDLLGGHVDFMFDSVPSALPHVQAKRLRALALTGSGRSALLPETATFDELGYPGQFKAGWGGVFAPQGLPPSISAKLQAAIRSCVNEPGLIARLESAGVVSVYRGSADFKTFVHEQDGYWGNIIKASGIKI